MNSNNADKRDQSTPTKKKSRELTLADFELLDTPEVLF